MTFRATGPAARLVLLATCLALAAGCAPVLFPVPDEQSRIDDPSFILKAISDRRGRILNVSGTGRISGKSPQGILSGRLTAAVTRDGLVRLDAWTPTWDLVGSFIGDPEGFVYYTRADGLCQVGESTPAVIGSVLPLGLDFTSIARIFAGSPPVIDGLDWNIRWDRSTGAWLLTGLGKDGGAQRIWADADGVTRRTEITDGHQSTDIRFTDFINVDRERMASRISISVKRMATTVIFKEIEVNAGVTPDDFEQRCPEGVQAVYIN